ncbi:MAG TPA: hypothetical protein DIW48_11645 [Sphaerochaeta sp.]|nr:hypothetical protein [Sphaerochaeta sp.]HCS37304.1 hypothetical protein [Sphaerochaeta sp.]
MQLTMGKTIVESFIWYFFLYSMLGYVCEVLYCSLGARRLVNRGFLHGPYIPVYGFGAIFSIMFLTPFKDFILLVFLLGLSVCSVIEYVTGLILELGFHTRLWDYSGRRFSIRGRICLLNSVLFGFLVLAVLYWIQPAVEKWVGGLPGQLRTVGASGMLLTIAVDTTASIFGMAAFTEKLARLKRMRELMESRLVVVERLEAEIGRLHEQLRRAGYRLLDAFPGMRSLDFDLQLGQVRKIIEERRAKRNQGRKHRKGE